MRRTQLRHRWTGQWPEDPWDGFPEEVEHLHRIVDWTLTFAASANPGSPLLAEAFAGVTFATYLAVAAPHAYKLSLYFWPITYYYFDNWHPLRRRPASAPGTSRVQPSAGRQHS